MTTITDQRPLLKLLAWLSPAFPTGGFAYSHGLEWAVEAGDIKDGETLLNWIADVLSRGSGRTDTILLRHAHRASGNAGELREIVSLAIAAAPARERRDEAFNQGRAFQLAVAPWTTTILPDNAPYSVTIGAVAATAWIPEDATATAWLQAFATNLISAAVRLVPLGQTAGLSVRLRTFRVNRIG